MFRTQHKATILKDVDIDEYGCVGLMNRDIVNPVCVVGGDPGIVEAPTQPRWSPNGMSSQFIIFRGLRLFVVEEQNYIYKYDAHDLCLTSIHLCSLPFSLYGGLNGVVLVYDSGWVSAGDLFFVSDRGSGFWNLYSWVCCTRKLELREMRSSDWVMYIGLKELDFTSSTMS